MNNDEVSLSQTQIVESVFEQQRIAAALPIEAARAFNAMNVNR